MNTAIIKPQWGPLTIALMVLGFVVFWPLGPRHARLHPVGRDVRRFVGKGRGLDQQVEGLVPGPERTPPPRPRQLAPVERQCRLRRLPRRAAEAARRGAQAPRRGNQRSSTSTCGTSAWPGTAKNSTASCASGTATARNSAAAARTAAVKASDDQGARPALSALPTLCPIAGLAGALALQLASSHPGGAFLIL